MPDSPGWLRALYVIAGTVLIGAEVRILYKDREQYETRQNRMVESLENLYRSYRQESEADAGLIQTLNTKIGELVGAQRLVIKKRIWALSLKIQTMKGDYSWHKFIADRHYDNAEIQGALSDEAVKISTRVCGPEP